MKEAGHSRTELVFSQIFDELGVPLVRLRPPPAQGCTLFSQSESDSRARKWIEGFVKYLAIFSRRKESSVVQS